MANQKSRNQSNLIDESWLGLKNFNKASGLTHREALDKGIDYLARNKDLIGIVVTYKGEYSFRLINLSRFRLPPNHPQLCCNITYKRSGQEFCKFLGINAV